MCVTLRLVPTFQASEEQPSATTQHASPAVMQRIGGAVGGPVALPDPLAILQALRLIFDEVLRGKQTHSDPNATSPTGMDMG